MLIYIANQHALCKLIIAKPGKNAFDVEEPKKQNFQVKMCLKFVDKKSQVLEDLNLFKVYESDGFFFLLVHTLI